MIVGCHSPGCGKSNTFDDREMFCSGCGTRLRFSCPCCGKIHLVDGTNHCPNTGKSVAEAVRESVGRVREAERSAAEERERQERLVKAEGLWLEYCRSVLSQGNTILLGIFQAMCVLIPLLYVVIFTHRISPAFEGWEAFAVLMSLLYPWTIRKDRAERDEAHARFVRKTGLDVPLVLTEKAFMNVMFNDQEDGRTLLRATSQADAAVAAVITQPAQEGEGLSVEQRGA